MHRSMNISNYKILITWNHRHVPGGPGGQVPHFSGQVPVICLNCCSIVNKYAGLQALITSEENDLILATESHLDYSITNSEVFPTNVSVYRRYSNRYRGGAFILVKNKYHHLWFILVYLLKLFGSNSIIINNNKDIILLSTKFTGFHTRWAVYFSLWN